MASLTLVGLRGLGDVDGELTAERVHSHHPRVSRASQRRQLVVTAGDAVERLGEVGRSLQDDLLQGGEGERGGAERRRRRTVIRLTAVILLQF